MNAAFVIAGLIRADFVIAGLTRNPWMPDQVRHDSPPDQVRHDSPQHDSPPDQVRDSPPVQVRDDSHFVIAGLTGNPGFPTPHGCRIKSGMTRHL
jgi:hypothetical protein